MMRVLRFTTLSLALAIVFAAPLAAQKTTPVITSATVSADQSTLFIVGSGFGSNPPTITLGGFVLGGVTVDSPGMLATAAMPVLLPGSYLLTVQAGNNKSIAAFEMTLGAQGEAGPTGPAGTNGANGVNGLDGAPGAAGPTGPTGATGIVGISTFAGVVGDLPATGGLYQFAGPFATIVTTATQRVTGAATTALGLDSGGGGILFIRYGLCYQPTSGLAVPANFAGPSNYIVGQVDASRQSFSATYSVVPGAGTWRVGFCVLNSNPVNNNDFVNGWVMVTNP